MLEVPQLLDYWYPGKMESWLADHFNAVQQINYQHPQ